MAHRLSTAPSYAAYQAAMTAHTASVVANGGQHADSVTAAKEVCRKRTACMKELKIPRNRADNQFDY